MLQLIIGVLALILLVAIGNGVQKFDRRAHLTAGQSGQHRARFREHPRRTRAEKLDRCRHRRAEKTPDLVAITLKVIGTRLIKTVTARVHATRWGTTGQDKPSPTPFRIEPKVLEPDRLPSSDHAETVPLVAETKMNVLYLADDHYSTRSPEMGRQIQTPNRRVNPSARCVTAVTCIQMAHKQIPAIVAIRE
jgi:hypothetical protein